MELTRRDAVVALTALGIGAGIIHRVDESDALTETGDNPNSREPTATEIQDNLNQYSLALADTLYPTAVTPTEAFIETYILGRSLDDDAFRRELLGGFKTVDELARTRYDTRFPELSVDDRDAVLQEFGLEDAAPNPDPAADLRGRMRYYLIDEFLYALFTSPTGGSLVGTESPVGHPGGLASYQRGLSE